MEARNKNLTVHWMGASANAKPIVMTVVSRQQAPDEQRRFRAATDALLMELVRQQMGRKGNQHG